jgi:hypothetical protein
LIPQLAAVELARWRADASRDAPLLVDVDPGMRRY